MHMRMHSAVALKIMAAYVIPVVGCSAKSTYVPGDRFVQCLKPPSMDAVLNCCAGYLHNRHIVAPQRLSATS